MAFQTVLVYLDADSRCAARVAYAASLVATGGVLVGAAMSGVSRLLYRGFPAPDSDTYLELHLAFLRERAQAAVAEFRQQMQSMRQAMHAPAYEARVIDDEAAGGLSLQARVADILVLSQDDHADMMAQVLTHSGRPVLVLPATWTEAPAAARPPLPRRILVAWDASREAGRALASALPLLREADTVELIICETDAAARVARDVQTAEPLPYLARHGVAATLHHHTLADGGRFNRDAIGAALLSVAANGFDLLVMGAYAHSRLRETLLGGATRTVLAHMQLPVLLEH